MIYGYIRVSSTGQNTERQKEDLRTYCINNNIKFNDIVVFEDKASGKNMDRPQYKALKTVINKGDTIIITELDRLGRNKEEVKTELNHYKNIGVIVRVLNIPTTLLTLPQGQEWVFEMINNILIEVLGAIAEEERNKIRARQRQGIDVMPVNENGQRYSSKTGNLLGREKRSIDNMPKKFEETYKKLKSKNPTGGTLTTEDAAAILKMSRSTLNRWIKLYESEVN